MLLLLWSLSLFCSKKVLDSWNLVVQWLLKSSQNKLWENGGLVNASGVWTNTTGLTCMDLLMNWPPGIQLSVFKDGIFQEPDYKRLQFAAGCQMDLVMSAHQPCPINYTSTAVNFCILMSVLFFFLKTAGNVHCLTGTILCSLNGWHTAFITCIVTVWTWTSQQGMSELGVHRKTDYKTTSAKTLR